MNAKRFFFVMLALLILLGGAAIGGVVYGSGMLKKQSDKLVGLKLDNQVLEAEQAALGQARKDIEKYSELEIIAKTVVPQEKDQARTVREIINLANAAGIPIASITFPASNLGVTTPTVTPEAGTTATPAAPAAPTISQVKPVQGIPGLYELEITVTSNSNSPVPYSRLIDFLTRLEQNRRTAQVTTINVTPAPTNRRLVSFNLTVKAYIKP